MDEVPAGGHQGRDHGEIETSSQSYPRSFFGQADSAGFFARLAKSPLAPVELTSPAIATT
jgi:hypothetical protein